MVNINDAFPSNYLKASDLKGREIPVNISHVTMEDVGSDHKPILYFMGKEKGLVLNKTNSMNIATAYGPETDGWGGRGVILYPAWVDFQGRSVESIRVRPNPSANAPAPVATPTARTTAPADMSEEIPF